MRGKVLSKEFLDNWKQEASLVASDSESCEVIKKENGKTKVKSERLKEK